jgi:hypothetical protein
MVGKSRLSGVVELPCRYFPYLIKIKMYNLLIYHLKWLNEGFATLFEYYSPHLTYPGERWNDLFLVDVAQRVLVSDANPAIRPMTYYAEDPQGIDNLFDSIAYSKCELNFLKSFL